MTALSLKLIPLLLVFTLTALGATRWLAFDATYAGEVAAVVAPTPDCESRCFMGITPGAISMRDAVTHLEKHPWVGGQIVQLDDGLLWNWSGAQPPMIDASQNGIAGITRVHYLSVHTTIPLYHLQVALGDPAYHEFAGGRREIIYRAYYPERGLHLISVARCPAQIRDVLGSPALLVWGEESTPDLERILPVFRWEPGRCSS